jgi:hypothetical protein
MSLIAILNVVMLNVVAPRFRPCLHPNIFVLLRPSLILAQKFKSYRKSDATGFYGSNTQSLITRLRMSCFHNFLKWKENLVLPGAKVIKILTAVFYKWANKFECLALSTLHSPV